MRSHLFTGDRIKVATSTTGSFNFLYKVVTYKAIKGHSQWSFPYKLVLIGDTVRVITKIGVITYLKPGWLIKLRHSTYSPVRILVV